MLSQTRPNLSMAPRPRCSRRPSLTSQRRTIRRLPRIQIPRRNLLPQRELPSSHPILRRVPRTRRRRRSQRRTHRLRIQDRQLPALRRNRRRAQRRRRVRQPPPRHFQGHGPHSTQPRRRSASIRRSAA